MDRDLSISAAGQRCTFRATFAAVPEDIRDEFSDVFRNLAYDSANAPDQLDIYLEFSANGRPFYRLTPRSSSGRSELQARQMSLISAVLRRFRITYLDATLGFPALYDTIVRPQLAVIAAAELRDHLAVLEARLTDISSDISSKLESVGIFGIRFRASLGDVATRYLIGGFDLHIRDAEETALFEKGQGVQMAVLLTTLIWISEQLRGFGLSPIWLVEEPESHLHPALARQCAGLVEQLREVAQVVICTHSLSFVPYPPEGILTVSSSDGVTSYEQHDSYLDATRSIRQALGMRFSEYFGLSEANVFVEGRSDQELLGWFLDLTESIDEYKLRWSRLRRAEVREFGGVRHLSGFLRANYPHLRMEVPVVAVFDGDEAGEREVRDLQQFFGRHAVQFQNEIHFVVVRDRFSIEGMFPDSWIGEIFESNPSWFTSYATDVQGNVLPYRIDDAKKASVQAILTNMAEQARPFSWASSWTRLCDAIDSALEEQARRQLSPKEWCTSR